MQISACINISLDTLSTGLMAEIGAQLDILCDRSERIYENALFTLTKGGNHRSVALNAEHWKMLSKQDLHRDRHEVEEIFRAMGETLHICVEHHRKILAQVNGAKLIATFNDRSDFQVLGRNRISVQFGIFGSNGD